MDQKHPDTFHLVIASVGETYYDGAAVSANLPAEAGQVTILPHHEPLVTVLATGTIRVKTSLGEVKEFHTEGGILECSGTRVVVLL